MNVRVNAGINEEDKLEKEPKEEACMEEICALKIGQYHLFYSATVW